MSHEQEFPVNIDGKTYSKEEYEAAFCDDCACGKKKPDVRVGCDDCERAAMLAWHADRKTFEMVAGWTRVFEPQWSCGPYYLYFKTPPDREKHEYYPFTACELGVTINVERTGDWSHLDVKQASELHAVLGRVIHDQRALVKMMKERPALIAKLNGKAP